MATKPDCQHCKNSNCAGGGEIHCVYWLRERVEELEVRLKTNKITAHMMVCLMSGDDPFKTAVEYQEALRILNKAQQPTKDGELSKAFGDFDIQPDVKCPKCGNKKVERIGFIREYLCKDCHYTFFYYKTEEEK